MLLQVNKTKQQLFDKINLVKEGYEIYKEKFEGDAHLISLSDGTVIRLFFAPYAFLFCSGVKHNALYEKLELEYGDIGSFISKIEEKKEQIWSWIEKDPRYWHQFFYQGSEKNLDRFSAIDTFDLSKIDFVIKQDPQVSYLQGGIEQFFPTYDIYYQGDYGQRHILQMYERTTGKNQGDISFLGNMQQIYYRGEYDNYLKKHLTGQTLLLANASEMTGLSHQYQQFLTTEDKIRKLLSASEIAKQYHCGIDIRGDLQNYFMEETPNLLYGQALLEANRLDNPIEKIRKQASGYFSPRF